MKFRILLALAVSCALILTSSLGGEQRIPKGDQKKMLASRADHRLLMQRPRIDLVVKGLKIWAAKDCQQDRILKVEAVVCNIGDADYNADFKATNIYWDYADADDNGCISFDRMDLPSIPKGKCRTLVHFLKRSDIPSWGFPNLIKAAVIKVFVFPNEQEDQIPEKDFTNNLFTKNVKNPCSKSKLPFKTKEN